MGMNSDHVPFRSRIAIVVLCIFFCGILFSMVNVFFFQEEGNPIQSVLFYDTKDSFMDIYHPIRFAEAQDPYQFGETGAIYPPICYLIFRFYGALLGADRFVPDAFAIRDLQSGRFLLILFLLSNILPFCYIIYRKYKGSELTRVLLLIFAVASGPYLFLLERANILLLSFWLTFLFVMYYQSSTKWVRESALIALALASAIKIYPAIFGLLLIMDKKYKEAIRCAIYGFILFFVPFFCFNGITSLVQFFHNLSQGISDTSIGPFRVDWTAIVASVFGWVGLPAKIGAWGAKKILIPAMLLLLASGFLQKPYWKKCLVITMVSVMLPSFSFYYAMVFYLIPLFLLLQEREHSLIDVVYGVLLAFSCVLFMTGKGQHTQFIGLRLIENESVFTSWSVEIAKLSQFFLLVTFGVDTILTIRSMRLNKKMIIRG